MPKNNRPFWEEKFSRNVERDRLKERRLQEEGWTVIVVWECQISKDIEGVVDGIASIILRIDGPTDI